MLDSIQDGNLYIICSGCSTQHSQSIKPDLLTFNEEFNEYRNYITEPCPNCGVFDVYNINIETELMSIEEIDEAFMPNKELNQRKYVIDLIHLLREDFANGTA